jgi:hypothetical protein
MRIVLRRGNGSGVARGGAGAGRVKSEIRVGAVHVEGRNLLSIRERPAASPRCEWTFLQCTSRWRPHPPMARKDMDWRSVMSVSILILSNSRSSF